MRLIEGDVLDADTLFVAANIDDPIDHEKRITVRQRLEHRGDVGGFQGFDGVVHGHAPIVRCRRRRRPFRARAVSAPCISRNHCLIGLAGEPNQRAPAGTLPCTPLTAAICAPSPMVTLLFTPTRAPSTTKSSSVEDRRKYPISPPRYNAGRC